MATVGAEMPSHFAVSRIAIIDLVCSNSGSAMAVKATRLGKHVVITTAGEKVKAFVRNLLTKG